MRDCGICQGCRPEPEPPRPVKTAARQRWDRHRGLLCRGGKTAVIAGAAGGALGLGLLVAVGASSIAPPPLRLACGASPA